MAQKSNALLHGTLEALILKALSRGRRHGYGIARWIEKAPYPTNHPTQDVVSD